MTSFYVGIFSWFKIHFIAMTFRKIFTPPLKVETLEDKACLNLFVKEVVLWILKGLKVKVNDITTFYKLWDEK